MLASAFKRCLQQFCHVIGIEKNTTSHTEKWISAVGAFIGICGLVVLVQWLTSWDLPPVILASMGAAAVLVFAVPHSALAQPWSVLAGNGVSGVVGLLCYYWVDSPAVAAGLAVGLAVLAMYYLRCLHPPGGATALFAVIGPDIFHNLPPVMFVLVILANTVLLVALGILFNAFFRGRIYPHGLNRSVSEVKAMQAPVFSHRDLYQALEQMDVFIDIAEDDLYEIIERATDVASQRAGELVVEVGRFYSNASLRRDWSIREVLSCHADRVHYRVVAGYGLSTYRTVKRDAFARWLQYEVELQNGLWLRKTRSTVKAVEH